MCFGQITCMSQVPHLWDRSDISNFLVGLLSGLSEYKSLQEQYLRYKNSIHCFHFPLWKRVFSPSGYRVSTPPSVLGNIWQVMVSDALVG